MNWLSMLDGKKVCLVSTSSPEYIRIKQLTVLCSRICGELEFIAPRDGKAVRPLNLKRMLGVLTRALSTSFRKYDTVILAGMPQVLHPFLKHKIGDRRLIIDFFISMYDTLVEDRKRVNPGSLSARFLKALDARVIRASDVVLTDTKAHRLFYIDFLGLDPGKSEVLYLDSDRTVYNREAAVDPLEEFEDKFKVLFFGAVNPLQGFEHVVAAAEMLADREEIVFLLVGPVERAAVHRKALPENMKHLSAWLSQEELCSVILASDLVLVGHFAEGDGKAARTIPGKAFICRDLSSSFILGDSPAVREVFSESDGSVVFVHRGKPGEIAGAVLQAYNSRKLKC